MAQNLSSMVTPGSTILYRHVEAVEAVKIRPALVLRVVGGCMLLVVGQTAEPRGPNVLVSDPKARLQYATFFDCRTVIAAPVDRVERQLGRIPVSKFNEIVRLCGAVLDDVVQRARSEAELQRQRLAAAIGRQAEANGRSLDDSLNDVADQARIARLHLREVVLGSASWTRDEIARIAQVLGADAEMLLAADRDDAPR